MTLLVKCTLNHLFFGVAPPQLSKLQLPSPANAAQRPGEQVLERRHDARARSATPAVWTPRRQQLHPKRRIVLSFSQRYARTALRATVPPLRAHPSRAQSGSARPGRRCPDPDPSWATAPSSHSPGFPPKPAHRTSVRALHLLSILAPPSCLLSVFVSAHCELQADHQVHRIRASRLRIRAHSLTHSLACMHGS
jgi:hypothetical protein